MANEPKAKKRKAYTTKHVLYKLDGTRVLPGKTVYDDELTPGSIPSLIESGALADPDAPIAPSLASARLAHELLATIAIDGGVVTESKGVYAFGDRKIPGDIKALCAVASIDELRAAIVTAMRPAKGE
ncbi:MAG: hypothetical protein ACXW5J_26710 [Thermoanaerobaculia bacterium]